MFRPGGIVTILGWVWLIQVAVAGPKDSAPPSPDRPWSPPNVSAHQADLQGRRMEIPKDVVIDPRKIYHLPELIDLAQRINPDTKVAWQRASKLSPQ